MVDLLKRRETDGQAADDKSDGRMKRKTSIEGRTQREPYKRTKGRIPCTCSTDTLVCRRGFRRSGSCSYPSWRSPGYSSGTGPEPSTGVEKQPGFGD